jgi:hypothetical protein
MRSCSLLTNSGNDPPVLSTMHSYSLVERPIMKRSFFLSSVSTWPSAYCARWLNSFELSCTDRPPYFRSMNSWLSSSPCLLRCGGRGKRYRTRSMAPGSLRSEWWRSWPTTRWCRHAAATWRRESSAPPCSVGAQTWTRSPEASDWPREALLPR